MKQLLFVFSIIFAVGVAIPAHAQTDSFSVFFASGKYQTDVTQKARLDTFLQNGKLQKAPSVLIMGYGDKAGGDAVNKKLSQQRADVILRYLTAQGVAKEKILSSQGLGIRDPGAKKDTASADRRVNILLMRVPLNNKISKVLPTLNVGQTYVLNNINFLTGSHRVDTTSYGDLEQLYLTLLQHPGLKISIEGHICCAIMEGDAQDMDLDHEHGYYQGNNLSVHRAKFITDYLVSKGIDKTRLSYTGYGNTKPLISPERTPEDQKQNRRVEIRVVAK